SGLTRHGEIRAICSNVRASAAEQVERPARIGAEVELRVVSREVAELAGGAAAGRKLREPAGPRAGELRPRLFQPGGALRQVEVVGDRRLDELGQQRIVEQTPVAGEIERPLARLRNLPLLGDLEMGIG